MHRRPRLTRTLTVGVAAPLVACAAPVDVETPPSATDPLCAGVLAATRSAGYDELAGLARRDTDAQSTAAWGDPPVVLRCGVEPPGPTTDPCVGVDDVDWVVGRPDEDDDRAVFVTYGRVPAVEVSLPSGADVPADAVLADLGAAVAALPKVRECL